MKKNIGAADGFVRLLIAIVLICYAILVGPWWLALIAIVPIATTVAMWCPLYEMFGTSTNKEEASRS
ncbi:MAG: DUF2892 domain-containing protein [Bacteroidota bacterium]